jgi:hypothetical protein
MTAGSNLPVDHGLLQHGDFFRRIESLRAGFRAIHDGMAAIEPERVFEIIEPFAGGLVTRVLDPAIGLQLRGVR